MSTLEDELFKILGEAISDAMKARGHLNILIAGRSGVGKSTLINAMFNGEIASTGQGRPVTKETREYTKADIPISIFDTRGLEMKDYVQTACDLESLIKERKKEPDPNRHLHVAWLCIQEDGRRVEEAEIALHEMLDAHVPVIAVITKARADRGFSKEVQSLLPKARNVVRVRAIREELDDGPVLEPMNLKQLVDLTAEVVPEGHKRAFIVAQKVSLEAKVGEARKIIDNSAKQALLVGVTPIPLADIAALVAIQASMFAQISVTFGLDANKSFMTTLLGVVAGSTGSTLMCQQIVGSLLKFIPGLSTTTGLVVISGVAASSVTKLVGEVYLLSIHSAFSAAGNSMPSPEAVITEFKRRMAAAGRDGKPVATT